MTTEGPTTESVSYHPSGSELEVFRSAYDEGLPLMITGPTGCGKTRMVRHMAVALGRPVVTVTCHDDLTSADLLGRFLVVGGDVRWIDGPLTTAVRTGAICYLDEVIEARRDTLAVLHSVCDDRRQLHLERTGETLEAPSSFMLVCSYNPESRGVFKELKPSLRQRFVTIEIGYLDPAEETKVVMEESGVSAEVADRLVRAATAMRDAREAGLREPPSTRLLVTAARLRSRGLDEHDAIDAGLLAPLSAGGAIEAALRELVRAAGSS